MISKRNISSILLRKRRAVGLDGVLVTIIIMVASIVLATGVVLYGTSLFQGGSQTEEISVTGTKLWVHGTAPDGLAWGAFAVRNTGDKLLSLDRIIVRGTDVPFTQWYPDTTVSSSIIQQPMNFSGWAGAGGMLDVNGPDSCAAVPGSPFDVEIRIQPDFLAGDGSVCASTAAAPVGLDPGAAAIIYFKVNNGTLNTADGGSSTNVNVFAGRAGAPQSISIASKT